MTTAVAIALYNGARFIEEQLDTIRLQTKSPDFVVLCDDGSTDNTVALVKEYIEKYSLDCWKLIENEHNLGYIKNFYKAISLCETDLVFLSDQDDIWEKEKIEKMTAIMEKNEEISLLSCKYGIIDSKGELQHSVVEPQSAQKNTLHSVSVEDIMRAYRWPGMVMCLKKSFFDKILPFIEDAKVAHDFMFVCLAADTNGFYEYDWIGAYHRRHNNNTAREEHRVSKLLNLERKLFDIAETQKLWNNFLNTELEISQETRSAVEARLLLLNMRKEALEEKSLSKIVAMYKSDRAHTLRFKSFVCDLWLVLFG